MNVELYSFEDAYGCEQVYTTFKIDDARQHAVKWGLKLIANTFEFSDSEVIEDHTEPDCEDMSAEFGSEAQIAKAKEVKP